MVWRALYVYLTRLTLASADGLGTPIERREMRPFAF